MMSLPIVVAVYQGGSWTALLDGITVSWESCGQVLHVGYSFYLKPCQSKNMVDVCRSSEGGAGHRREGHTPLPAITLLSNSVK